MSHTCQRCGATKAAADMLQRAGKPSKTCVECWRKATGAGKSAKSGGG